MKKTIIMAAVTAMALGSANAAYTYFKIGASAVGSSSVTGTDAGTWTHNVAGVASSAGGFTVTTSPTTNTADATPTGFGGGTDYANVTTGIIWSNGVVGGASIDIAGLAEGDYNIKIFAGQGGVSANTTDLVVTATGTGSIGFDPAAQDRGAIYASGLPLSGTATVGTGGTSINISNTNTGANAIWGLGIEAVPEPSSAALLGLGGLALILRRRK